LYGVGNSIEEQKYLQPVSQLKTVVLQVTAINSQDSVGYGRRFVSNKDTHIATIPIGYADDIRRRYGYGLGEVVINNKRYRIVGSISIDMLMVEIGYNYMQTNNIVEVFSKEISIQAIANRWETITYEIMTSISQRVKREYYK